MAVLTTNARKQLGAAQFAVPAKAPATGSYPIPDPAHAENALARSSDKAVAATVKTAVKKKFPSMKVGGAASMIASKKLV